MAIQSVKDVSATALVDSELPQLRVKTKAITTGAFWEVLMFGMTAMQTMMAAWGGVSVVLVVLLMHRLMLGIHEDDELFLDSTKAMIEQEQMVNTRRINAATPWVNGLLTAWVALAVAMVVFWIYTGLYS